MKRILSKKGETIVETLVSILIVAMASIAMAVMVSAATTTNEAVKLKDAEYYTALSEAENGITCSEPGSLAVTVDGNVVNGGSGISVNFGSGSSGLFTVYTR